MTKALGERKEKVYELSRFSPIDSILIGKNRKGPARVSSQFENMRNLIFVTPYLTSISLNY